MLDQKVRAHLSFLQGSSSTGAASSSATGAGASQAGGSRTVKDDVVDKLHKKIDNLSNELRATKCTLSNDGGGGGSGGKRRGGFRSGNRQRGEQRSQKGKGKGKNMDMAGFNQRYQGQPICFNFNRPCGCEAAAPGAKCARGWHVCIKCGSKSHGMASPECRS